MTFGHPALLVGLLVLPVLGVLYVRAERRSRPFAPAALMPSVVRTTPGGWRRHAALVGYGIAVATLVVAAARPQATVAVPTKRARVMVVTDHSGSMRARDVKPTRLAAAKRAAETFLGAVPDRVQVGAVAFNDKAEVLQSPTRDHDAVREALQPVRATGRTAIGDALKAALGSLEGNAPAAIVLLSDGDSVRGSDPLEVARQARGRGIPVSTVALGTDSGTINGKPAVSDPRLLAEIARTTGGRAYTAEDADALDQVYERLGSQVATHRKKQEVTHLFAGGALALMALSALGSIRLRGRLV